MGVTNFPNGIAVGDAAGGTNLSAVVLTGSTSGQAKVARGTAIITAGSVNVSTGLTTTSFVAASPYGILLSTAGTVGGFVTVTAQPHDSAGGSAILRAYDQMGTIAVASGTATWVAFGS